MAEQTYSRLKQQVTDRGPWQQTASGQAFFLGDPQASEVNLSDVATALSKQCRYNGHTKLAVFYSVAQHAATIAKSLKDDGHPLMYQLAGLHHDSGEGYMGDFVSQVKWLVPEIRALEDRVDHAVHTAFGVEWTHHMHGVVKQYDFIALATEVRDVLAPNQTPYSWGDLPSPRDDVIQPMGSLQARAFFLERHVAIKNAIRVEEERRHGTG